jgi:hypothetical protein
VFLKCLYGQSAIGGSISIVGFEVLTVVAMRSRDSAVGIATAYELNDGGVGVRVLVRSRIFYFPRRPDRLWGPRSPLSNGYRWLFPRGKAAGA